MPVAQLGVAFLMGFRVGVGPRILRMHVGTRGVGVSSGAGPFSAYAGATARRRRRSSANEGPVRGALFLLVVVIALIVQFWRIILLAIALVAIVAWVVMLVRRKPRA